MILVWSLILTRTYKAWSCVLSFCLGLRHPGGKTTTIPMFSLWSLQTVDHSVNSHGKTEMLDTFPLDWHVLFIFEALLRQSCGLCSSRFTLWYCICAVWPHFYFYWTWLQLPAELWTQGWQFLQNNFDDTHKNFITSEPFILTCELECAFDCACFCFSSISLQVLLDQLYITPRTWLKWLQR